MKTIAIPKEEQIKNHNSVNNEIIKNVNDTIEFKEHSEIEL